MILHKNRIQQQQQKRVEIKKKWRKSTYLNNFNFNYEDDPSVFVLIKLVA